MMQSSPSKNNLVQISAHKQTSSVIVLVPLKAEMHSIPRPDVQASQRKAHPDPRYVVTSQRQASNTKNLAFFLKRTVLTYSLLQY